LRAGARRLTIHGARWLTGACSGKGGADIWGGAESQGPDARADGNAADLLDASPGEVSPEANDAAAIVDAADALVDAGPCTDPLTFDDPILEDWLRRAARLRRETLTCSV
jgi:hypothetical protein